MKTEEQERKELINSLLKHFFILASAFFVGLIVLKFLGTPIQKFINSYKWFLLLSVTGTVLYVSWAIPLLFREYKQNLRRTWYFVLIVGMLILLKESGFDTANWQRYLYLAGMFIFVDLALFLTPTIKKFGGAEMETVQDIESVNKQMQRAIKKDLAKSQVFTSIISRLQRELLLKKAWTDPALAYYGEACMQEIIVFYDSVDDALATQLNTVLGIELDEEMIKKIEQEQIVEIDTETVLIPFSHQLHPVVIAVLSQKESVTPIDVAHIIDLSVIHTWQKLI